MYTGRFDWPPARPTHLISRASLRRDGIYAPWLAQPRMLLHSRVLDAVMHAALCQLCHATPCPSNVSGRRERSVEWAYKRGANAGAKPGGLGKSGACAGRADARCGLLIRETFRRLHLRARDWLG
ncbi:hypothetical protein IQ07DRAFT_250102 [Pyrenochaeta sp. DS3sAY3a]|nr:hypothetical protein IQ07DRAFT_250102 [Pyrenochaeta sp. DS3sAY3a]